MATSDPARAPRPIPPRQVRRIRAGLISLMLLAAGLAAGMLLVRHQLENLRAVVQAEVAARVGAEVRAGAVFVNGLRGLRIDNLEVAVPIPGGPGFTFRCPAAYLDLDLPDLLSGRVSVSRVRIDRALFQLDRPEGAPWIPAGGGGGGAPAFRLPDNLSFRVSGSQCRIRLRNVAHGSVVELDDIHFDLARLPEARDLAARLTGRWSADGGARFHANVRLASLEDFDLRAGVDGLRADDVNDVLREPEPFVETGVAHPRLRATGYPDGNIVVSLDVPVEDFRLRGHPEFLEPVSGAVTALATYHTAERRLQLATARAESTQIAGRVEGDVSFAGESPELNLRLEAARIPVDALIGSLLQAQGADFGDVRLALDGPYAIAVGLTGSTADPVFTAEASVASGSVALRPKDARFPAADLRFGAVRLAMSPGDTLPVGTLSVTGGTLEHSGFGLRLQDISGSLTLGGGVIALEPFQARFAGNTLVGRVRHDLAAESTTFALEGIVAGLENTPLGSGIPDVWFAGEVGIRCAGVYAPNKVSVDADLDLTRARFDLEWWLRKPVGMGASLRAVNLTMLPGNSIAITGTAEVSGNALNGAVELRPTVDGGWSLNSIRLRSDSVDVVTLGRCFRIPYTASGGALRDASLDWRREGDPEKGRVITITAHADDLILLADDTAIPLRTQAADVRVVLDDRDPDRRLGEVVVRAGEAHIPPFSVKWLLPLQVDDPALEELYPPDDRAWRIEAKADRVSLPPWQGTEFSCVVLEAGDLTIIEHYHAKVDGGVLEGDYRLERPENLATLQARWTDIPAHYMLRHLELPQVLNGTISGEFRHTVDEDDPATMEGDGAFIVRNGRFDADELHTQFGGQMGGSAMQLPPSLQFSELRSKVRIAGDRVETSDLLMDAEGIRVTGGGSFVTSGDLDYQIAVAIKPETAQTIPILRSSFNLEGHRLTQTDIQLAFDIKGPLVSPDVKLTGLPGVGETLVSGAFELGSEAIRVIDLPRQILLDLFKIGGGILGSSRQQRNP